MVPFAHPSPQHYGITVPPFLHSYTHNALFGTITSHYAAQQRLTISSHDDCTVLPWQFIWYHFVILHHAVTFHLIVLWCLHTVIQ